MRMVIVNNVRYRIEDAPKHVAPPVVVYEPTPVDEQETVEPSAEETVEPSAEETGDAPDDGPEAKSRGGKVKSK